MKDVATLLIIFRKERLVYIEGSRQKEKHVFNKLTLYVLTVDNKASKKEWPLKNNNKRTKGGREEIIYYTLFPKMHLIPSILVSKMLNIFLLK